MGCGASVRTFPADSATAFIGSRRIARGDLATVAVAAHETREEQPLIFDDTTGHTVDIDLRGSVDDVLARLSAPAAKRVRGRPKLGVVAREVTLLPRHWDWLASQPGGASAALRRLVDQARRETVEAQAQRRTQEVAYHVATTLAGDRPGYEEAIRALFAGDITAFHALIDAWPPDIAAYLRDLTLTAPS
jgi:hypothetical protein